MDKPLFEIQNGTIEVYKQNKYGTEFVYIKNPEIAGAISNLTGRKTLTDIDIKYLKRLGFTLKLVLQGEEIL